MGETQNKRPTPLGWPGIAHSSVIFFGAQYHSFTARFFVPQFQPVIISLGRIQSKWKEWGRETPFPK